MATRIVEAAAFVLESEGPAACNSNRIAKQAGISVGSFYQYFPTKESALAEVWREREGKLASAIASCAHDTFSQWLDAVIAVFIAQRPTRFHRLLTLTLNPKSSPVTRALHASFQKFQEDIPAGIGQSAAADLAAIITALNETETQSLAGWQYTLAQRIRRTVLGYLAIR
jgi:AcrR family transcriptional regulator